MLLSSQCACCRSVVGRPMCSRSCQQPFRLSFGVTSSSCFPQSCTQALELTDFTVRRRETTPDSFFLNSQKIGLETEKTLRGFKKRPKDERPPDRGRFSCRIQRTTLWGFQLTRYSSISADGLIRACADSNDADAWAEFVSRFHRAISLSVVRIAHQWGEVRRHEVDDLVQETYVKLCADRCSSLLEFSREHPDATVGYIKTIAVNQAHDHFKSLHSQKRGAGRAQESLDNLEPRAENASLGSQDATERQVLMQQIDQCLATCSAGPDRNVIA